MTVVTDRKPDRSGWDDPVTPGGRLASRAVGSPPPRRRPPRSREPAPDRTRSRALGLAGVAGLFVVLVVVVVLLAGSGGGDAGAGETTATATASATPEPTATPKPMPTRVPLTPDEKLDRQDDIDLVRSRGYDVVSRRDWKPDDTLQVLIGRSSSGGELAFFFVDGQYLGNDSMDSSGRLRLRETDDLSVTLRYGTYASGDPAEAPSGEPVDVEFRYEGGRVSPVEPIPEVTERTPGG